MFSAADIREFSAWFRKSSDLHTLAGPERAFRWCLVPVLGTWCFVRGPSQVLSPWCVCSGPRSRAERLHYERGGVTTSIHRRNAPGAAPVVVTSKRVPFGTVAGRASQ